MTLKDEIPEDNIKLLVQNVFNILNNSKIKIFKDKPTGEIFAKGNNIIGISLIDNGKPNIECTWISSPHRGKFYLFAEKNILLNSELIQKASEDQATRIINEIQEDNAYTLNIKRVDKLIEDKHYSVAIVFLVSAFENAMRDIFFQNNIFWFYRNNTEIYHIEDYFVEKYGIKEKDLKNISSFPLGYDKDINGEKWILTRSDYQKCLKWKNIKYYNKIFSVCEEIGVYNNYIKKIIANDRKEIGQFDILKDILHQFKNRNKFSFQRIFNKGGVVWCFKNFYYIDLSKDYKTQLDKLKELFDKRHSIIHGKLDDNEIEKADIEIMIDLINKVISYLKDRINQLKYNPDVIMQFGSYERTIDYT